ncbi:hypothetical protein [Methylomagnum ishizawai]|uniref:hypothetical protein n=1 Tax=Methylomagnum ishizawai TaxID=1760988 RepID=UPI000F7477BA|nr:hypothetical protein [Methylomagnum ishizawai]
MAYLSAKEIKQLKGTSLESRVLYIFVMRSRMSTDGTSSFQDEDEIATELAQFFEEDNPTKVNVEAISRRLSEMQAAGILSPTDVRKIRSLLL